MATSRQPSSTGNVNSAQVVIDMDEKVYHLEPSATPLTKLLTMVKSNVRTVTNPKFQIMRQEVIGRRTTVGVAGYASTTANTAIPCADSSLFSVGSVVENIQTGEHMRVASIDSATQFTAERQVGSVSAAAGTSGDTLIRLGTSFSEGADVPSPNVRTLDDEYNYTQIFRRSFGVTNTARATKMYSGPELDRIRGDQGIEFALDIEHAFLFGQRGSLNLTGDQPRRMTRGLLRTLSTNVYPSGGALSESNFEINFLEGLFRYGSDTKVLLASARLISVLDAFGRSKLQIDEQMSTKLGVAVKDYISGHGMLKVIKHKLLEGNTYSGYGIAIDPKYLRMAVLQGRNTKLLTNRQNPGVDGVVEEYLAEVGLDITLEKVHGVITGVTSAA